MFTKGSISIDLQPAFLRNAPSKLSIYNENNKQIVTPKINYSWSFKNQAIDFISCLKNKNESKSSGKNSLKDYKLIEKILKLSL